MTVQELRKSLEDQYGLHTKWPDRLLVDADTYANVCDFVFNRAVENNDPERGVNCNMRVGGYYIIDNLGLGPHRGIMFKDVEISLRKSENGG